MLMVQKPSGHTVMSNTHLKDRRLSLEAKGLLSMMLSMPDGCLIDELISSSKEDEETIKATLKELEVFGYLDINQE